MDRFDIEKLVKSAGGGPFRLTVLLQKRLEELKSGAPRLVDLKSDNLLEIACQEIIEKKIDLTPEEMEDASSEAVHELFRSSKPKEKLF